MYKARIKYINFNLSGGLKNFNIEVCKVITVDLDVFNSFPGYWALYV